MKTWKISCHECGHKERVFLYTEIIPQEFHVLSCRRMQNHAIKACQVVFVQQEFTVVVIFGGLLKGNLLKAREFFLQYVTRVQQNVPPFWKVSAVLQLKSAKVVWIEFSCRHAFDEFAFLYHFVKDRFSICQENLFSKFPKKFI